jgi:hypothetical protein
MPEDLFAVKKGLAAGLKLRIAVTMERGLDFLNIHTYTYGYILL